MSESERGQVVRRAAEVYDEFFLPALFCEWTAPVTDAAALRPGQVVLDVACGTGVLARAAAGRVGRAGSVVGLDRNEGMLAVAKRKAPEIEWRQGLAESLPFDAERFDAVVSQFGLMFFEDRPAALREMMRVLRPGGRLAVAVWAPLDASPGYAAAAELLQRLFGEEAASALRMPFVLGDVRALDALFAEAGIAGAEVSTREGTARFPSIRSWMHTDIRGWTLADSIDDAQFECLVTEAERTLGRFTDGGGGVAFAVPGHIVTAAKPPG